MSRAYCYCRVSHISTSRDGVSTDIQKEAGRKFFDEVLSPEGVQWAEYAFPLGEDCGMFVDEVQSGWKKRIYQRPAGKKMVDIIEDGDHVIIYSIDRGFRNVSDFARTVPHWIKRGISVHLITERFNLTSANGMLIANVLAAVAQFKSDMISERTREALAIHQQKVKTEAGRIKSTLPSLPSEYNFTKLDESPEALPGRVFGYRRVSHLDSVESGLGLNAQQRRNDAYIQRLLNSHPGLRHGANYVDEGVSAFKNPFRQRQQGKLLDQQLQSGDHVVFARLDRAWRSIMDMMETLKDWEQRGIHVHFVDIGLDSTSLMGQLSIRLMCVLAEWESESTSIRTKGALSRLKAEGKRWNCKIPPGFKQHHNSAGRILVPNMDDIYDAFLMVHMRRNGIDPQTGKTPTWEKISDVLEVIDAHRQRRDILPRYGKIRFGKTTHRRWHPNTCSDWYHNNWKRIVDTFWDGKDPVPDSRAITREKAGKR